MARKKDSPQKAALRELMGNYLKENNVKVKDGTDVNSIMQDMMSIILEGALDQELDEELGYSKYDYRNKETDNSRNGHSQKTLHTSYGDMEIDIPRNRNGDFEPQVVKKYQNSITQDMEEKIISMYAKGMTRWMDLIKIGKYIASKRKSLGMTQKQLAEKLGMSDKSVSKWERGVCLPDVSVYKELCSILGISLNEFLAGEDIAQENMIQKSETNIIEVITDNINKQKCLKVMKCILVFIFICVVSVIGFTIYRLKKPQNYISPVAKDSIEMQTAELLAGSDGAFVYKFITTDKYKKLKLHIYRYESGKLSDQDKVEMGFEDSGSPKSGKIVMVPDFDNYVIKLVISGDGNKLSTEIPILENVEDREYYGRTATEIKNVVDVKYNEQQPLIAFVYDNDGMSVPTLDDFINSQIDFLSKNDYVYYVAFEFCK